MRWCPDRLRLILRRGAATLPFPAEHGAPSRIPENKKPALKCAKQTEGQSVERPGSAEAGKQKPFRYAPKAGCSRQRCAEMKRGKGKDEN
jgi:hypothetical protein